MRRQMSKSGFRAALSLLVFCALIGVVLEYTETASSQKKESGPSQLISKGVSSPKRDGRIMQYPYSLTRNQPGTLGLVESVRNLRGRSGPSSAMAVNFAVSRPVSELALEQATLSASDAKLVTIRDKEEALKEKRQANFFFGPVEDETGDREKNLLNKEITRKIDPNAPGTPDAAIASVPSAVKRRGDRLSPQVMPTPTVNFEATSLTDTTALPGQGFLPPDTVGEIGPNHFVQLVNVGFRIYNRAGTPLIPLTSIGTLFGTISGPCAGNEDGDPIVLYDQMADRWVLSEFCVSVANPNNHQLIAVSKTGDPTGAYYLYDFMMPNNKFNDYPHFGVWSDGYYMTDNQFNQAGTQFLGAGIFAFDRTKMIAGDPTAGYIYFDKAENCPAACSFAGMLPGDIDGFTPPPAGAPNTIIQFDADEFGGGQTDSLRIFDMHVDYATPANSTLTERTGSPLAVAAFDPREVPAGSRNVVPQPAPGIAVDVISDRVMNRLSYRNFGTYESLALNHSVNVAVNPAFRSGVRYYEIRKPAPAAPWSVQEQGTMSGAAGDTTHRWMGSTAINGAGSQAIGYSASSSTVFPSVRYAGRLAGDPAGSLGQGEATLVAGTSSQTHTSGRWGDYSDLTVDPVDDCTFWYTQQYVTGAASPDNTRWHTRIGAFQFGPCVPVQKGILSGTVTSAVGGGAIVGASVAAGPFIRSSNGGGLYNIDPMGTGTYTVTASAPGYASASVPGVTVTTGNTTMQNLQLVPLNVLNTSTPAITAESCAANNNALDPGEVVTINLPIINNGGLGATTTNLVATLQAVGGVASPSGPQNYGAVAQGAPAVVRPYTFTVSATCGAIVNITLQLQDGATNYGTIVYSLRTGTLGTASTAIYSTGNISTPIADVANTDIPITIAATGAVADVNVKVRLNHTFDGDVSLSLVAPDNTIVPLSAQRSSPTDSGDNYGSGSNDCSGTPTIFDDAAAAAISTGTAPFAGTFRPESPLSAMNGKSLAGTWKLRVTDAAALDVGTVGCVQLEISRQPFICCGVVGSPMMASGGPAALTAESFIPVNTVPDPGETVTVNLPVINTGDGNTTSLVGTLQATGGVTIPSVPQNYGVVVAAGAAVARPFTFTAAGNCGDIITLTLALQDGAINLGTATYTMRLGTVSTSTATFANATAIVIPNPPSTGASTGAPANPYPSNITVAGVTNPVTKVTVKLKGYSHTFPDDVDVLLVGPTGVKFILMSDAGGGTDIVAPGVDLTFDDGAAAGIVDAGPITASGTFKPTNIGTGDAFPAPAPAAPYLTPASAGTDTLASAFNGLNPNGTWSLYVTDDAGSDIGTFAGGWQLTLESSQNVCSTTPAVHTNADLRITKTDGVSTVTAGGTTTYTIVASNPGPDPVAGATVTDNFPNTITSVSWTCVGANGGICPASGMGNISAAVDLPVGGFVTFTAIANISSAAAFGMTNTATISGPIGNTDPVPGNNSAKDVDNICAGSTFTYSGPVVPIPDGVGAEVPGAPADVTLNVSGVSGPINDINFSINGTTCSTTIGSTTVGLDHTFVGDLRLTLISPFGTQVTVINRLAGGGGGNSGNNFCQMVLDDEAVASIQAQLAAAAPFTGTFTPNAPLSAFDGQNPNGTWTLRAQDFFVGDVGSIRSWSLVIGACSTTAAGVAVSGRVLTPDGRGLRNARVVMRGSDGIARTVTTSSFGFYQFDDVSVGHDYVIGVISKQYRFASRILQVDDTLTDVDFVGLE